MSRLACQSRERYSYRMTEFKPLAYATSVVVFLLVVAFVAVMQWNPVLQSKVVMLSRNLAWAMQWNLGKLTGTLAWVSEKTLWAVYCLAELWCPPVARPLFRGIQRIWRYQVLRSYIGAHAA